MVVGLTWKRRRQWRRGLATHRGEMDREEVRERKSHRILFVSLTWIEQWKYLPGLRENPSLAYPPSTGSTSVVEGESLPPTRRSPSSNTALVWNLLV